MNSSDICHQVSDCPGLYVDAFRGHFLREHTKNPDATFILSHYHSDHYTQLPRDNKYSGPAKIHCTPITARILIDVHLVDKSLVVEHEYGSTFRHRTGSGKFANITFYDANHCPGACIILIEMSDGKTTHLHTGDMRYHPRFQSYPLLSKATKQRKVDLVYLDTTYCHPKHNFLAQEDAVDKIASQTQQLLSGNCQRTGKTLVLLSCYSIGKEKVLYESSMRSKQLIYVSEKKWKMLRCIQEERFKSKTICSQIYLNEKGTSPKTCQDHYNIMDRFTRDPTTSDLHVIPMGLAGEMWPYFQPNYQKLAKYVEDLLSSEQEKIGNQETDKEGEMVPREYNKVVAFIPTGWADATNWNKKNAISTKTIQLSSSRSLHVEVRLISYSEHSTFPELVSFVQYLKPRKVIPTVYSDLSHKRQIEGRFRNMLDSTRAKQAFFRSMTKTRNAALSKTNTLIPDKQALAHQIDLNDGDAKAISNGDTVKEVKLETRVQSIDSKCLSIMTEKIGHGMDNDKQKETEDDEEVEFLCTVQTKKSPLSSHSEDLNCRNRSVDKEKLDVVVSMGFNRQHAEVVLEKCDGNVQRAIDKILSGNFETKEDLVSPKHRQVGADDQAHRPSAAVKKRKISDFFIQKDKQI